MLDPADAGRARRSQGGHSDAVRAYPTTWIGPKPLGNRTSGFDIGTTAAIGTSKPNTRGLVPKCPRISYHRQPGLYSRSLRMNPLPFPEVVARTQRPGSVLSVQTYVNSSKTQVFRSQQRHPRPKTPVSEERGPRPEASEQHTGAGAEEYRYRLDKHRISCLFEA
jgi:hypothetical protein